MGLLEKVNLESSTESIFTVRKHDDGLGERLLETIENESQPSSVILIREHKFNRGGRSPSAIVPLVFGGLFIIFPLGIALFALITEPVAGLCFGVFTIPFLFFGGKMVQGPIDMFLNPQPEEEVVQKYWFDRNNKFIAIIEEIYDVEEEEEYAPEILKAFYLAKTDEIKVLYDPPSDGAVTPGSSRKCIWDSNSGEETYIVMNLEWFSWSERKIAIDKAKEYSKMMRVQFTGEGNESGAWNMDVANPDGNMFFITRGGPDSMY
ncbi:MAG: hypothetical protein HN684_02545 [Euryarchaeota archaeon]|nr:hypothetical protein [Euryarchaeota archaeon]